MKVFKNHFFTKLNVILLTLIGILALTISVNATEDNILRIDGGAYYETKVDQTNEVGYGVSHNRYLGYSQIESKYARPGIDTNFLPQRTNVLNINQDENTKVVAWGTIENGVWKENTIIEMAKSYERLHPGWRVVAAINGDFFDINKTKDCPFTPSGAMISDGDVIKSQCSGGWGMLGFYYNEQKQLKFFPNNNNFSKTPTLSIYDNNNNIIKNFVVNKINEAPGDNETSVYYGVWNNKHNVVPQVVENEKAYVVGNATLSLAAYADAFYGKGEISLQGKTTLNRNQFAIVTNNKEVETMLNLGVTIRVQQEAEGELGNADSAIGCKGIFMQDGNPIYALDDYDNARFPRTIIGQNEQGKLMMAVIDGRQAVYDYYGTTGVETSAILKYYGFHDAYQMDGGGSTTMAVLIDNELKIVNSPSDSLGKEPRKDSNGILVATRVNEYDYKYEITENSITISLITISELEKYKYVYVQLNGKKNQVVNGKVTFDNLDSDTVYKFRLYANVDGEFIDLLTERTISTAQEKPVVSSVAYGIKKSSTSDFDTILTVNFSANKSLIDVKIIINDVEYSTKNKSLTIDEKLGNLLNANIKVKIIYDKSDGKGTQEEIIEIEKLKITSSYLFMDYQLEEFQNSLNNLLK